MKELTGSATADRLLTDDQRRFANLMRDGLIKGGVQFDERVDGNGHEAWYVFEIKTSPHLSLRASIALVDDMFVFEANGAEMHRDRAGWPDGAAKEWMDECVGLVNAG